MSPELKNAYGQHYTEQQAGRSGLRKAVRRLYLNNILGRVRGKSLDFGCGIGELLALLPPGSTGLDINPPSVERCRAQGLAARLYDPENDRYEFRDLRPAEYTTFLMVHVLEHLPDAGEAFAKILSSLDRLRFERLIVVVPGPKGFRADPTHRTYISPAFFRERPSLRGFSLTHLSHFPLNFPLAGVLFRHNELLAVYDRKS